MHPTNKFMLAIAVIWALFVCYGIMALLPFMNRRLREWDMKIKRSKVPLSFPNYPQRVVFLLLTSLMLTVALTSAFGRDLKEVVGISPGTAICLMLVLPALYFALGCLKKIQKHCEQPKS